MLKHPHSVNTDTHFTGLKTERGNPKQWQVKNALHRLANSFGPLNN